MAKVRRLSGLKRGAEPPVVDDRPQRDDDYGMKSRDIIAKRTK
jgi:hypothetical protein